MTQFQSPDDATDTELAAHANDAAVDGGPHGLPALADGMAWVRQGGALVAVDVATQAELQAVENSAAAAQATAAAALPKAGGTMVGKIVLDGDPILALHAATRQYVLAQINALGAIGASLVDAKGDLLVATANDTIARKAAGTDGYVLVADSAQGDGLLWRDRIGSSGVKPSSGQYYGAPGGPLSVSTRPSGWITFVPFLLNRATTFDRIALGVTAAGSAGSVLRLGIWADNESCKPFTRVLDAGTIDGTVVGVNTIAISQLLQPGLYWLSCSQQGAPATLTTARAFVPATILPLCPTDGGVVAVGWTYSFGPAGALPADTSGLFLVASQVSFGVQLRAA